MATTVEQRFLLDQLEKKYKYPFDWGCLVEGVAIYAYAWRWPIVILTITILVINKL